MTLWNTMSADVWTQKSLILMLIIGLETWISTWVSRMVNFTILFRH